MLNNHKIPPRLAIIIPCYNEELTLPDSLNQLITLLYSLIGKKQISEESFLYCVDDGSRDNTWKIISNSHQTDNKIKGLRLSRNAGHQNALLAGLLSIQDKVECAITIDADLQDDINAIPTMLEHFKEGSDIVYGVRQSRETDGFFKRLTALTFYKLMRHSGSEIVFNHADFRLLSQKIIKELNNFKESNIFLRGIFSLMGFKTSQVFYDRNSRALGTTKYSLRKMISLAWEGLISFSQAPLDFILFSGILSFIASIGLAGWVL